MKDIFLNVLPVFLLIFAGWALAASRYLRSDAGDGLSAFVFKVAVPVLLFRTLAEADFQGAFPIKLWIAYFGGVAITWGLAHVMATRVFRKDQRTGVVTGVSSAFANTIFIGLPLVERNVGPNGLVALSILIAVHLPVMMIASSILIERAERQDTGRTRESLGALILQLGRNLTRNPLMFGILIGVAWHLAELPLTGTAKILTDQVAGIAGPAALISLGMAMQRYKLKGSGQIALLATGMKLFVLPGCVLMLAQLLGLNPDWQAALVLTASVPTGVNAWLIASQFKTAESLAASTIALTTALGAFSVSFWAYMLG